MPFPRELTIRPFTNQAVESIAEDQLGVYGIFKEGVWIYIGSGDIRERMTDHLAGDIPCILNHRATDWVGWVTNDYKRLEKELIVEFQPVCNQRVG